ncbi:MAG TPA: hypothetical protein VFG72_08775 [Marmoricola sp.]|nr:hypothetical protein [Marmoricola sp.]
MEFVPEEHYALDLLRERGRTSRNPRPAAHRRTTRKSMAKGLHRLADRLDG